MMFTNIVLALGFLVALTGPPDFSKMPVITQSGAICPNGVMITITDYDSDPQDPDAWLRVFEMAGQPVAVLDGKKKEVYVYAEKRTYSLEDIARTYPSPCGIPIPVGA